MSNCQNCNSKEAILNCRNYAKENSITKSGLALMAGLSDKTLSNFWGDDWNPTIKVLQKVEAAISRDFKTLPQDLNKCQEKDCGGL